MIDVKVDGRTLTADEQKTYERGLSQSHLMRVTLRVLDQDEKPVSSFTADAEKLLSGQVNVDTNAEITRQLTIEVLDEDQRLVLDKDSPAETALYPDKFISVVREDYITGLGWVECPVFWGPLTRFERQHPVVSIEAMGKEVLVRPPVAPWKSTTIKKGTKITAAIRKLLGIHGETRFDLPELDDKTKKDISEGKKGDTWKICRRLADSIDRQLFYDGRGKVRLRKHPENPVFTFRQKRVKPDSELRDN